LILVFAAFADFLSPIDRGERDGKSICIIQQWWNLLFAADSDNNGNRCIPGEVMYKVFVSIALFSLASVACSAEINMRPGLWEMTATSDLLSLAEQIPPEQMQNLRNLAQQYGVAMPTIKNGAASSKVCITAEMAEKKIPPYAYHQQSGCEARNAIRTGNHYSADLACTGEQIKGEGKAEATLMTPESFSGYTRFSGLVRGVPVDERAETSGRWIAPDCTPAKTN
jgi:hypothetical protein